MIWILLGAFVVLVGLFGMSLCAMASRADDVEAIRRMLERQAYAEELERIPVLDDDPEDL